MPTLRVLLGAPPSATRADAWALFDDTGRFVERGHSPPERWPMAANREVVLAASLVRVIALALPPMPPSRVAAAAAYALEDRLASTEEPPAIGLSAARADGSVVAAVASRGLIDSITGFAPRFTRALAEPSLAPPAAGWTWCASGAGGGFVRSNDGSAFAVAHAPAEGLLPPELAAALTQTARKGDAPGEVIVAERCAPETLDAWRAATGVPFVAGRPWRWDDAPVTAFAAAPDLLARPAEIAAGPRERWRLFRPALAIAGAALALHVIATVGQWGWLRYEAWRTGQAIIAAARAAGINDAETPDAALRALANRDADLRHRAGLAAATDALPLLARAAPTLAALPAAAIKSGTYADGAWTFELASQPPAALETLDRNLRAAGLAPLQARTAAGHRVRVSLAP